MPECKRTNIHGVTEIMWTSRSNLRARWGLTLPHFGDDNPGANGADENQLRTTKWHTYLYLDNMLRYTAKFFIDNSKHQLAVQILERINSKSAQDLQDLAIAYIRINDYVRAVERFEEAVQKDPDEIFVNARLGSFYCYLGYSEKALPFLKKINNSYKTMVTIWDI